MKIAITADCHLTSRTQNAERYAALESILADMKQQSIRHLVIAGDCFDQNVSDLSDFEELIRNHSQIHFHLLPGNHDAQLRRKAVLGTNVQVYEAAEVKSFDLMSLPVLFLPYAEQSNMGQQIGMHIDELPENQWVLISHGDWIEGLREHNAYEPGVYMPLTRTDMEQFKPRSVILGHIHKPYEDHRLAYTGSPYPLHINETGKRRYIILDTDTGAFQSRLINSPRIYQQAALTLYPTPDARAFLDRQIAECLEAWQLDASQRAVTQLRIRVRGYAADREAVALWIEEGFSDFDLSQSETIDYSGLHFSESRELAEVAARVYEAVDQLEWAGGAYEPDRDMILLEALKVIYEE